MRLDSLTRPELVFPRLPGDERMRVLHEVARRLAEQGVVGEAEELYRALREREEIGSTGLGCQVAVPHCKVQGLERAVLSVGLCEEGVDFAAQDGLPVRVLFTLVSPEDAPGEHLQALAAISKWVKADHHVERILELDDPVAIYELLRSEGEA